MQTVEAQTVEAQTVETQTVEAQTVETVEAQTVKGHSVDDDGFYGQNEELKDIPDENFDQTDGDEDGQSMDRDENRQASGDGLASGEGQASGSRPTADWKHHIYINTTDSAYLSRQS